MYKGLFEFEWYTLNKSNMKLYYMFVMYTQKSYAFEILPSVLVTLPLIGQVS